VAAPRVFRRWWFWALSGAIGLIVVLVIMTLAVVPLSSDTLRHRMIATLSERLDSRVELGDLHLRVFPALHAEGSDLIIRWHGRTDVPPLISIAAFSVDASLSGLLRKRVAHVQLTGLDIQIPPDHGGLNDKDQNDKASGTKADRGDDESFEKTVVIDTLETINARLIIVPKKEHKDPKVWAIHALKMHNVGATEAMPFEATLTNGVPPGEIETTGSFGPWEKDDPGLTPLDGKFDFAHADLSVFKGISGLLSAKGTFAGTLERILVDGDTDTPDFTLTVSGHPFALHAKYRSLVDGTNGDTRLENIDANFLSTHLLASGAVLDAPAGRHGRTLTLDVKLDKARIEDMLTMAVKDPKPLMTGALQMTTKFVLPPGETDVVERLRLDGRFAIAKARFTKIDVQTKINELSHRARAKDVAAVKDNVVSNFQGRFKLANGVISLPDLTFDTPGAKVQLAGQFALRPETLDFKGQLLMDAKISQTVGGVKGLLLKVVDPIFKKDGGGSLIPIKIGGTVKEPSFGLDVRRVFRRGN
jgi:AsmA-like C-terminal region